MPGKKELSDAELRKVAGGRGDAADRGDASGLDAVGDALVRSDRGDRAAGSDGGSDRAASDSSDKKLGEDHVGFGS